MGLIRGDTRSLDYSSAFYRVGRWWALGACAFFKHLSGARLHRKESNNGLSDLIFKRGRGRRETWIALSAAVTQPRMWVHMCKRFGYFETFGPPPPHVLQQKLELVKQVLPTRDP